MKLLHLISSSLCLFAPMSSALSWPPLYGKGPVPNLSTGGRGGTIFDKKDANHPVKTIQLWETAEQSIKAIRIVWDDVSNTAATIGIPDGDSPQTIDLAKNEKITSFVVWADEFVEQIEIKTDQGQTMTSGAMEDPSEDYGMEMDIGSGYLAGFRATSDSSKIYRLKPYFLDRYKVQRTHNPLHHYDSDNGGLPYSLLRLDRRVEKVEGWWGASDVGNLLRKLQVTYEGGGSASAGLIGGAPPYDYKSYTFNLAGNEVITKCSKRVGMRTDQLYFKTDKGREFLVGGPLGNYAQIPDLGNGILLGFEGRAGWDINQIAPVFAK